MTTGVVATVVGQVEKDELVISSNSAMIAPFHLKNKKSSQNNENISASMISSKKEGNKKERKMKDEAL